MQLPILSGIYATANGDIRTTYPINRVPVPLASGLSTGYLRPADGIVEYGTGPGTDRGAINWNDVCFRVMGSKLVRVNSDGACTPLGDITPGSQVSMAYSFDRLAIATGGDLFYYDGITLSKVTDPDIGTVLDVIWVDGYFMTTDGEFIVVTELTDPASVNPLKYGSAEADPDPIKCLIKIRNEPYALNRYTIEAFQNIGGEFFPFQRVVGAQIQKGTVGTHAACMYMDAIAFVGSGKDEAISVYIGLNGQCRPIATREIDMILATYTETQLSACVVESRAENGHQFLMIHLPDRTLVYDASASEAVQQPVWFTLSSAVAGYSAYRARNHVFCYGKWIVGDPTTTKYGYLTDTLSTHYGIMTGWEFSSIIMYNEGRGAVVHELELVGMTGSVNNDPVIWASYSTDGVTWSREVSRSAGRYGERNKRITWLRNGVLNPWRIQKFRGTSDAHVSIARIEAQLEPLYV